MAKSSVEIPEYEIQTLTRTEAYQALQEFGAFFLQLPTECRVAIDHLVELSNRFFAQEMDHKSDFLDSETLVGFRPEGIEYSCSPDRPDKMTSLSYNLVYHTRLENLADRQDRLALLQTMQDTANGMNILFCELLSLLAGEDWAENIHPGMFDGGSFLQINDYQATHLKDEIQQDAHEDGNILTILCSSQAGLEVSVDSRTYREVTPGKGRAVVFGGEILSLLSGGALPMTYHRVVRKEGVSARQSMMFFGNPSQGINLQPWEKAEQGTIDIARLARDNSQRFGLPVIPH